MDLLVLGGTRFVGRHAVVAALARGHRVTLVHRSPTDLFSEAEHVLLDRTTGPDALAPLDGRTFDGLLDICGYVPRVVRASSRAMAGRVGSACFVSSVSAYAPGSEEHPSDPARAQLWPTDGLRDAGASEDVTEESYGPLKVACEQEFVAAFPDAAVVRPTYVIGPFDPTDRFGYWVRRMADGGTVLATDPQSAPVQLIDARDLGAFMVRLLEDGAAGYYDGVGPAMDFTVSDMLTACSRAAGRADTVVVGVDREWLAQRGVVAGEHLPLLDAPSEVYAFRRDPAPSITAGLTLRPVEESARDALAWDRARGLPVMAGRVTREQEAGLLEEWNPN